MIPSAPRPLPFLLGLLASLALVSCGGGSGGAGAPGSSGSVPVIETFSPASETEAAAGEELVFSVTTQGDAPCSFDWHLDGALVAGAESQLSLDTSALVEGLHAVSVDVASASGAARVTSIAWKVRIRPKDNRPPAIAGALPAGAVVAVRGEAVSFSVTATDPDAGDVLSYRWRVDGADRSGGAPSFVLDTSDLAAGAHRVEVAVSDGHRHRGVPEVGHAWDVTVVEAPPANRPPVISSASPASPVRMTAGTVLVLSVTASDPDGDPLEYRWTADGALQAGSTSTFEYAATEAMVGLHAVAVAVDDGQTESAPDPSSSWAITVESPPSPVTLLPEAGPDRLAVLPARTVELHGAVEGTFPAGSLSVAWSALSGPGAVTFADPDGLDTTATFAAPGTYELELRAVSGSVEATDSLKAYLVSEIRIDPSAASGTCPLDVEFAARHAAGGAAVEDLPAAIILRWDFGDGSSYAFGPRAAHRFERAGSFAVALALILGSSAAGCAGATVEVADPLPPPPPPPPPPPGEAIVIDHTHAALDPAAIPAATLEDAKARFRVYYGHTSHGLQILTGMNFVRAEEGSPLFDFTRSYDTQGRSGTFFLEHNGDLANPDWSTWASVTRAQLSRADNDRNIVMWSWCTQPDWQRPTAEYFQANYLDRMAALEREFPDVTFVYFTCSTGSGPSGSGNLRNEQVRQFCRDNGKVLFDFADIERWGPDGTYYPWVDDACNYYDTSGAKIGNWAQEWCARNPGACPPYPACHSINLEDLTCCAHTETINCLLKGRAFWWLLAELASRS
jgi:hypothetical protein